MFKVLKKIFGTHQSRILKKYEKIVRKINEEEKKLENLTDSDLKLKTHEFQERIQKGEHVDDLLPEAYAVVKNVCRRLCGTRIHVSGYDQEWDMVPYDVQLWAPLQCIMGLLQRCRQERERLSRQHCRFI